MSEVGDELEQLRVPFEKIKFGKKIEGHGYGTVFEGEFDHQRVALKRLNITNLAHIKPKLLAEILTISRFRRHPNLVALIGFCDEKSNEIILVYEFVSSGNLADKMRKRLTTIQRLEICLGAARGLDYLHTGVDSTSPGIIHGDIKPSKILLNSDSNSSKFEAKVSSFGLSKLLPGKVRKTVDSTDPAFEVTGKVTKESDVYCFGVLLLEVLCGVPELVDTDDYQERHVTELVPKRLEQNRLPKIVHFDIRNEIKTESLETYAKIACQCVVKNPEERPTMAQVVEELEKALRLQGGEVPSVQILGSRNGDGAPDGAVAGDDLKEDGNGVVMNSGTPEKEPEANMVSVERNIYGLISDVARENHGDDDKEDGNGVMLDPGTPEKEPEAKMVSVERNVDGLISDIAGDNNRDDPKEDGNGVMLDSGTPEKEPEAKIVSAERSIDGLIADVAGVNNGGEDRSVGTSAESRDGGKNAAEDITPREQSFPIPVLDTEDGDGVPNTTHVEDAQNKSDKAVTESTNDPKATEEIKNDPNSNEKLNITKENETDNSEPINDDVSVFEDQVGDQLKHLRIPFEKIKFVKRMDGHGYGSMFEGEYDNQQVALKKINITNLEQIKPKLLSDILTISRFHEHPNLVALIGFCNEKRNEIILVYEYITNGNLADKMKEHLKTIQRLEICLGAARGLDYLHTGVDSSQPGIVHGDIKLSKVLLTSKLKAKVSSFGLSRLLPGQVSLDLTDPNRMRKESDVYSFGVLLLEVLCGVSELVDTDDYQERHVSELVPKRLEQNMLRKIVHFDIRNEIKTGSLETYAKIACQCVIKSPEERPSMTRVVEELEKALRLQGEEVSYIQILASENGDGVPAEPVTEDDQKEDSNGATVDLNILEKEPESNLVTIEENINDEISDDTLDSVAENNGDKNIIEDVTTVEEVSDIQILASENGNGVPIETVIDRDQKEDSNGETIDLNILEKEPESNIVTIEEHANNLISDNLDSIGESNDAKNMIADITTESKDGDDADDHESKEETVDDMNSNEKSNLIVENDDEKNTIITASCYLIEKNAVEDITTDSQNSGIVESDNSAFLNLHDTEKKPEVVIELREGGFDNFTINDNLKPVEKNQESESKRSSSTSSESSNGDGTAPSDYLLHKSPQKKTTNGSVNCCSCAWWRVFSNRFG